MFYASISPYNNFFEQVNNLARNVAEARGNSLVDNARMFALMELGLADESIANWTVKYTYNYWRPVTAIRAADTDNNPETLADPNWLPEVINTAPDPSYPGAHAVISAGAAAVLISVLEKDELDFNVTSEVMPGVERPFDRLSAAAEEATLSRIFAGAHFRFDLTAGQRLGRDVADFVVDNFLTRRHRRDHRDDDE